MLIFIRSCTEFLPKTLSCCISIQSRTLQLLNRLKRASPPSQVLSTALHKNILALGFSTHKHKGPTEHLQKKRFKEGFT